MGDLSALSASELGAASISTAVERAQMNAGDIDEVIMGCVLPAGQGQAPARQAMSGAGVSFSTGAVTVNKMCGSGLYAVMMAHDRIKAGSADIVIAGGMESMSNAPHLLPKARSGYRLGHAPLLDHMFLDGLEDAYEPGKSMGLFAEQCARHYKFSRQAQDDYALRSLERAQKAIKEDAFAGEITPVTIRSGKTSQPDRDMYVDEQPGKANKEKIPLLKPAFDPAGTVTAAHSSSISDGAAALALCWRDVAVTGGYPVMARISGHAVHAQEPQWFTTAPVGAIQKLLKKTGWAVQDVDLFEVNEAFACVPMAVMHDLNIPPEKMNIHGGACALGHPIGASGARILVSLIAALHRHNLKKGIAALCLGGGEAVALAVELC